MSASNITNYKPKDFAELLGVSVKTLQRWDREGTLKAYRTPTNRRYYTNNQYLEFKGINLENDKHPNHIGDLPMIYSNGGYAYMEFFTSRFKPSDVINHVLMIHENMDDLMTDPAGNSGERIACGKIVKYK